MSLFSYLLLLKYGCSAHADNRGPSPSPSPIWPGTGTLPRPSPRFAGDGDAPPSPSPICRGRGRSPVPDSHRGVRALAAIARNLTSRWSLVVVSRLVLVIRTNIQTIIWGSAKKRNSGSNSYTNIQTFIWGSAKKGNSGHGSRVAVVSPRDHSKRQRLDNPNAEGTRTMPGAQRTEMPVRGRIRKADADV